MEIENFVIPEYLVEDDLESIHERMLSTMRENVEDLDISEGSLAWDFTRPTAFEAARMINYNIVEAIKNMFPMWAYGDGLDRLATIRGLKRKNATKSMGVITVTGASGTVIPKGSVFCTVADSVTERILFETTEELVLPEVLSSESEGSVWVEAVEAGSKGNVAANTIIKIFSSLMGVFSVKNTNPTSGGIDEESDDELRKRLVESDRTHGDTNVGSPADYKRWAMEVDGVGAVYVQSGANSDGTVKLTLMASDGTPASPNTCTMVYDHIMGTENREPYDDQLRLAPINAMLIVNPASIKHVMISAKLTISQKTTLEQIKEQFLEELKHYYLQAVEDGVVRQFEIASILINIPGVDDIGENLGSVSDEFKVHYGTIDQNGEFSQGGMGNFSLDVGVIPFTNMNDLVGITVKAIV